MVNFISQKRIQGLKKHIFEQQKQYRLRKFFLNIKEKNEK